MRVVDVKPNRMKEIGNSIILSIDSVDEVFVFASDINLASDCNFIV